MGLLGDWQTGEAAREYVACLFESSTVQRRLYGVIEQPHIPRQLNPNIYPFKIAMLGRAGCGKSATVARLCGADVPSSYLETTGIQMTHVYWPAVMQGEETVYMFRLAFWDAGARSLGKYDHIAAACTEDAMILCFCFSLGDADSWAQLQKDVKGVDPSHKVAVIATNLDKEGSGREVSEEEIQGFCKAFPAVPLYRVDNVAQPDADSQADTIRPVMPILNGLCDLALSTIGDDPSASEA